MKTNASSIIIAVVMAAIFFFAGYRSGATNGYNNGFKEGVEIAEEYAKDCIFELNYEVRRKYDISAYDAALVINKYDNEGEYLFDKYNDVVNAHFALRYFVEHVEYELGNISEVALELGEIPIE